MKKLGRVELEGSSWSQAVEHPKLVCRVNNTEYAPEIDGLVGIKEPHQDNGMGMALNAGYSIVRARSLQQKVQREYV